MKKIKYYINTQLPLPGEYKKVTFIVENEDGSLQYGYQGSEIKREEPFDENMTQCKVLVPCNAIIWLGNDGLLYYSLNTLEQKILAEKY